MSGPAHEPSRLESYQRATRHQVGHGGFRGGGGRSGGGGARGGW
jgi:uncharacterized membrane protein YgcG